MMKRIKGLLCGTMLAASLGWAFPARGTIVALYDFPESQGTTLPSASTDSELSSTAGDLSLGAGLPASPATVSSGISSTTGNPVNALFLRSTANSAEAFAVAGNKYISFTLTPTTALDFTSLDFQWYRQTTDAATGFALRTDAGGDNFTTTIGSGTMSGSGVWNNVSLDLTGVTSLQNVTTATTFRIYVWGSSGDNSNTKISRYDNFTLNATLVPEPASLALMGLGGLVMSLRSRRRD